MDQQPTPNKPDTGVPVLQWISLFLLLVTVGIGLYSIIAKLGELTAIINFLIVIVATLIGILQVNKGAFSFILKNGKTGMQVFGGFLLVISLSLNFYNYFFLPHQLGDVPRAKSIPPIVSATSDASRTPKATSIPYSPTTTPNSPPGAIDQSSLIPADRQPTVNDPLANNSQGYGWDQGANSQKSGTCDFVSGSYYQISAPAGNSSIGCNMENEKGIFSNFVYQIRMKILEGVDGDNASTCVTFRVNDTTLKQDQVCFSQEGYWSVSGSSGAMPSGTSQFPYFSKGINQINYITIRANGSTFQIQVNGHDLGGTYTDPGLSSGFLGVSLTPDTSESKVAFSNLRVWTL